MRAALEERPKESKGQDRELERLRPELEKKSHHCRGFRGEPRVKKGALKLGLQARFGESAKRRLLELVSQAHERTGWTLRRILKRLGLARSLRWQGTLPTYEGEVPVTVVVAPDGDIHATLDDQLTTLLNGPPSTRARAT